MAGYYKNKMSNNARIAYMTGAKPMSKWTKKAIMDEIKNLVEDGDLPAAVLPIFKKMTLPKLRQCLRERGWHHTSYMYNVTYFYDVDADYLKTCLVFAYDISFDESQGSN